MGNCCTMQGSSSSAVWAGDDWRPKAPERPTEKEGLLGGELFNAVGTTSDQVRIRISKKQLEELLRKVDASSGGSHKRNIRVEQVLKKLIDDHESDHLDQVHHHQRSWRPVLQSIPEVN